MLSVHTAKIKLKEVLLSLSIANFLYEIHFVRFSEANPLFYTRGISLPKIAYEISRISEIPKKIGRDFGISCKFGRDFRNSENFCQGFLDFQGFPKHSNRQNSTWHSSSPSLRIEVAARLKFRRCGGVTPPPNR